jgi:hypothetical protein
MPNGNEQPIFTDDLNNALGDGWTWLREHSTYWRSTQQGLEIRVEPGNAGDVQNALLRPAPDRSQGTYAIEIDIFNHTHPIQQYEQAGITWYVDGKPVFKLVKELIDGGLFIIPGRKEMPTQSVRLRLIVLGSAVPPRRRKRIPNGRDRRATRPQRRPGQHPVLQWSRRRRTLGSLF